MRLRVRIVTRAVERKHWSGKKGGNLKQQGFGAMKFHTGIF
jgi:hypothetical protein